MSATLTLTQAHAACHTTFLAAVQGSNGEVQVPLYLDSVTENRTQPGYVQFSLLLTGPLQQPLAQATFMLTHDTLGDMPVFLVPVGQRDTAIEYQAVFSYAENAQ